MIQNYVEIVFAFILKDTTEQSMMSQEKLHYDVTIITSFVEFTGGKKENKILYYYESRRNGFQVYFFFCKFL